jgi:hypothetical protein
MVPSDVGFDFSAQLVMTTFGLEFLAHLTAKYPMQRRSGSPVAFQY